MKQDSSEETVVQLSHYCQALNFKNLFFKKNIFNDFNLCTIYIFSIMRTVQLTKKDSSRYLHLVNVQPNSSIFKFCILIQSLFCLKKRYPCPLLGCCMKSMPLTKCSVIFIYLFILYFSGKKQLVKIHLL